MAAKAINQRHGWKDAMDHSLDHLTLSYQALPINLEIGVLGVMVGWIYIVR